MRLQGKVALITGAASGIGRATALLFGREGARVMCVDINGEGAKATAEAIAAAGGEAAWTQADVASDADAQRMVRETVERFGRLDILFNNAGVEIAGPVTAVPEERWDWLMSINLKGVYLGCKYAIPEMLKSGGGAIVNTASGAGLMGIPGLSAYCASKGGVILLTKSLAMEWATQGIRVNCVCPGVIRTPMVERAVTLLGGAADPEEAWRRLGRVHPIGRVGEPEEVARAVLFLASDEASFITGVALPVDGGWAAGTGLRQDQS
ncbi:MAG: SDR family oxidoreductase [Dehalococcoidia bacterium]|jgi:NAD(P)-dependent dehydrogenase (short-subunit alcohol dehydrogenase family)|nr:SDR family oxidoreductase [Dehalococcoidia bacterium]MDW8008956.1 SDR family oxidoreductase [Chloroflexota bacterium]